MKKSQEYLISTIGLIGVIVAILSILYESNNLALVSSIIAIAAIAVSMYFVYIEEEEIKVINITDINSSQESLTKGITLNCQNVGPSYITGNLTITLYPAECYYNGGVNQSSLDTNSIIQNAVLSNITYEL